MASSGVLATRMATAFHFLISNCFLALPFAASTSACWASTYKKTVKETIELRHAAGSVIGKRLTARCSRSELAAYCSIHKAELVQRAGPAQSGDPLSRPPTCMGSASAI